MFLDKKTANDLIELSFKTIKYFLATQEKLLDKPNNPKLLEKRGVFVTLEKKGSLRGCMGQPFPLNELWKAVVDSSINAAFFDPRFPALKSEELDEIDLIISVLSPLKEISGKPKDILDKIVLGKTGIFLSKPPYSGLLLPEVAEEFGFSKQEFMEAVSEKAGLPKFAWQQANVRKYFFETEKAIKRKGEKVVVN